MEKLEVKYVFFFGGHPNTRKIAEHLGARFDEIKSIKNNLNLFGLTIPTQFVYGLISCLLKTLKTRKKDGTIYFCEGIGTVLFPVLMRKVKKEKNIIISRINDGAFFDLYKNNFSSKYRKFLARNLNGVIGVTPMVAEDAKKYVKCPVYSAIYTLWRGYEYFADIKPDLKSRNFVFVGEYREHKGIDILAKALKLLKKKAGIKFKTYFVGEGIEENLRKLNLLDKDFIFTGKANPKNTFPKCTFYIHTARYEPGPTAVLEAMASGLIPVVNMRVGTKNIISKIDKELVINSINPEDIADHVAKILKKKEPELNELSRKFRAYVKKNNLERSLEDYEIKFKKILRINKVKI